MATWNVSIANWRKEADEVLPVFIKELGITPHRIGTCPDVLSVGLITMSKKGDRWSFGWMFEYYPFVLLPKGMIIILVAINDVPYLIPGAPRCQPWPVADSEAQTACGYSYINGSICCKVDVTGARKRKRSHQTGPAMANQGESTDDDVPNLFDPDEDDKPLGRLFGWQDDLKPSPSGAISAQTPVKVTDDPDARDTSGDEVRDYGRPLMEEGVDEEHATAMGQSGDDNGDDKDEWMVGSESYLGGQAK